MLGRNRSNQPAVTHTKGSPPKRWGPFFFVLPHLQLPRIYGIIHTAMKHKVVPRLAFSSGRAFLPQEEVMYGSI